MQLVLKMRCQDVHDGYPLVTQRKTGQRCALRLSVLWGRSERIAASVREASVGWQIRDLRAEAASDADSASRAQALLGHSAATTTDSYIRRRIGEKVMPLKIAGKSPNSSSSDSDGRNV